MFNMSGGEKQGFIGEAGHFKRKLDTNTVNFILTIQFKLGPLKNHRHVPLLSTWFKYFIN